MASNNNNSIPTTKRIILVDNEPDSTSVLSMGLEDEGYIVDAFNDPILLFLILNAVTISW